MSRRELGPRQGPEEVALRLATSAASPRIIGTGGDPGLIIVLASTAFVVLLLPVSAESAQLCYTKHEIASGYTSWSAMAADLDGDGDIDVVGTGKDEGSIAW